jgi:hypothetical protein
MRRVFFAALAVSTLVAVRFVRIMTLGGGYIWRFADRFYVDPWAGAHWTLNPEKQ